MSIEFHCEHCEKSIRAAASAAGKRGKCPFCGGEIYVPNTEDIADSGELPIAPLDDAEERKAREEAEKAKSLQRQLLSDREMPHEGAVASRKTVSARGEPSPPSAPTISPKQLNMLVVQYIEAMSSGQLEEAEGIARKLAQHPSQVRSILESVATEDHVGLGLPQLPRPVLLGFVKQLGARL